MEHLRSGTVMGILATQAVNRLPVAQDPFPGRTATFREITRAGWAQGVRVCVFAPRHVDLASKRVRAYFYTPSTGWVRRLVPFPPVVYNRIANRRVESRPRAQRVLHGLKDQGVIVFNPGFLDKWEVYDCLQADLYLRNRVPETMLYTAPAQLLEALPRWRVVYCKPRRGSLGTGITALHWLPGGRIDIRYNSSAVGTRSRRLPGLAAVPSWAQRHLRSKRHCLQAGIDLAQVQGRRFDIRALVQKDGEGEWRLSGAAARVAARGQLTTHVPRGGTRMGLDQALRSALRNRNRVREVGDELEALSLAAASSLERTLGECYGEFSLDVGMDHSGGLWILEMNSKPFRFDEPGIRHQAYRRLVDFAHYLASTNAQGGGAGSECIVRTT